MDDVEKPCAACPWIKHGQPDITPEIRNSCIAGAWFCCHTRMGTCGGAVIAHRHSQAVAVRVAHNISSPTSRKT